MQSARLVKYDNMIKYVWWRMGHEVALKHETLVAACQAAAKPLFKPELADTVQAAHASWASEIAWILGHLLCHPVRCKLFKKWNKAVLPEAFVCFFVTICRIVRQLEFHPINSFGFIQFRLSCFIGVMMNSNVAWWSLGRLKLCSLCRFKLPGFLQSCGRLRCEPSQ